MKHHLSLGIILSLLAALFYSSQTALVKASAPALPPLPVVIFIQSLVSLLLILPVIFKNGLNPGKKILATHRIKLHILRTIFSLSISYLLFSAVLFIPLVNGMLLANTAPLIVPFIAYLFLSEKMNHRLWVPILIGYSGVALVLHPDSRLFNSGSLLALGAGVALASTMLTVRKLSTTEATETTAFYFFLFSTIISGIISLTFWTPVSLHMWLIMSCIGALYFFCQYASTAALKYVNAQLVGSLFYSNIIYATVISQFVWHTLPSYLTVVGMVFIIIGGILCIRVEHNTKIRAMVPSQGELHYVKQT